MVPVNGKALRREEGCKGIVRLMLGVGCLGMAVDKERQVAQTRGSRVDGVLHRLRTAE